MDQVAIFSNFLVFNDEIYKVEIDHKGSGTCHECSLDKKLCCVDDGKNYTISARLIKLSLRCTDGILTMIKLI